MSEASLRQQAEATIEQGSKSFAAAARLFDAETRADCVMLYAWCRYCDDVIDGQELGSATLGEQPQAASLTRLREFTRAAAAGNPPPLPVFEGLAAVAKRKQIELRHLEELLDGFGMDVEARQYTDIWAVLDYAYHVAGVVGLMMAKIMGVSDQSILDRASDLGLAFQLTNIVRDVIDDARGGRVYLPADWLLQEGIATIDPDDLTQRPGIHRVASRVLDVADSYYESSSFGIARLPWRSAWAIAAARRIYAAIGQRVRVLGPNAWNERVSTSRREKLAFLMLALFDATLSRFDRRSPARTGLYRRP
jgi:phytoene synthase